VSRQEDEEALAPAVAALLEARAGRLKARRDLSREEESLAWVAEFTLGDEYFAIPLEQLRAAVPIGRVVPTPLTPPHVVGIFLHRGETVAALSLSALLGGRGWRQDSVVVLVVECGGHLVGLDCGEVPRPLGVPARLVAEARSAGGAMQLLNLPGRPALALLDLARLVERAREAHPGA